MSNNSSFAADIECRLDRLLVSLSIGTRAQVKNLIKSGCVSVDDRIITDDGSHVRPGNLLKLNGSLLDARTTRHIILHKPCGILTAARDPKQPTVFDLLPKVFYSLGCMPVGRLDKDTSGLLLFTTDGELSHRLLSPKRHVWKCYRAVVEGRLDAEDIAAFESGIVLSDFTALPARLQILQAGKESSTALVHVHEGKFHQVRRMFGARGHEVTELSRLSFGPLVLDESLQPGGYRELTADELQQLIQSVNGDAS